MDTDGKNEKFTLLDIRFTFALRLNALNGPIFDITPSLRRVSFTNIGKLT